MNEFLKRIPALWSGRSAARSRFFSVLRHIAGLEDTRDIFSSMLRANNASPFPHELSWVDAISPPYPELQRYAHTSRPCNRGDVIFITGRFRTGSTLLWNLFRSVPSMTSYYEPFNGRRWFDPATRGTHVDPTHLNVSDYWSEYDGLEELGKYFSPDWSVRHLYMPAHTWNPQMRCYIETLIERAPGRAVLQFNDVDFRLPWLRARFPHASIVHVVRHPRDQWCSTLGRNSRISTSTTLSEFKDVDVFYLVAWGMDLRHNFPFLTLDERAHPYELFYQIWKLSYLFGRLYADIAVSFEDIIAEPERSLCALFAELSVSGHDLQKLLPLVIPVPSGKWRLWASHDWFSGIEARVDETFADYAHDLVPLQRRPSRRRATCPRLVAARRG